MLTIQAASAAQLRTGGMAVPGVALYDASNARTAELSVMSGQITSSRTDPITRSITCTLGGFDSIVPDLGQLQYASTYADTNGTYGGGPGALTYGDLINRQIRGLIIPAVTDLVVTWTLFRDDGTFEVLSLGRFRVSTVSFQHTVDGLEASITGFDVSRMLSLAGWTEPFTIAAGTNVRTALLALCADRVSGLTVECPVSPYATTRRTFLPVEGANPLADARTIALLGGFELMGNRSGGLTAYVPADPGSGTTDWEITESTLIRVGTVLDDESLVNTVVVSGQNPDGVPFRGLAERTSGQWGTSSIGAVRVKYETVELTSQAQADVVAAALLRRHQGLVDEVEVETGPLPHIDPGDLVDLTDSSMQLEDTTYLVERLVFDLSPTVPSRLTVSRRLA